MTDTVEHWLAPSRNIHGQSLKLQGTRHAARVVRLDGLQISPFSKEGQANAGAIVWLIDHPRRINIGDKFEIAYCEVLEVFRVETRTMPGGTVSKAYLK